MLTVTAQDYPNLGHFLDLLLSHDGPIRDREVLESEDAYYLLLDVIFQSADAFEMGYVAGSGIDHLFGDEDVLWHHRRHYPNSPLSKDIEPPLPSERRLKLARDVLKKWIEEGSEDQNFNELEIIGTNGTSGRFVVISDICGQAGWIMSHIAKVPKGQTADEVLLEMGYFSDVSQCTDSFILRNWHQ